MPAPGSIGGRTEKPSTPQQYAANATGAHTTNHNPSWAAEISARSRLPAAIAGAVSANISGSS